MTIEQIVAENLRKLREERGMNQTEVAEKIGASQQQVSEWERGVKLIGTFYLDAIAELYGVSTDFILGRESKRLKVAV